MSCNQCGLSTLDGWPKCPECCRANSFNAPEIVYQADDFYSTAALDELVAMANQHSMPGLARGAVAELARRAS